MDLLNSQIKKVLSQDGPEMSVNKVTEDLINKVLNTGGSGGVQLSPMPIGMFNPMEMMKMNIQDMDDDEDDDDEDDEEDDDDDDEIQNSTFVLFTQSGPINIPTETTIDDSKKIEEIIEEIVEEKEEKIKSVVLSSEEVPKSEELSNPLSKSKLTKMNVAELQGLCKDRGLSTDGHKQDFINRLLGIVRE